MITDEQILLETISSRFTDINNPKLYGIYLRGVRVGIWYGNAAWDSYMGACVTIGLTCKYNAQNKMLQNGVSHNDLEKRYRNALKSLKNKGILKIQKLYDEYAPDIFSDKVKETTDENPDDTKYIRNEKEIL